MSELNDFKRLIYEPEVKAMRKKIAGLQKSKFPPLKKECHECGGRGTRIELLDKPFYQNGLLKDRKEVSCNVCKGTGGVWNRLTPEQYVEWMRTEGGEPDYKMLDTDRVWVNAYISGYHIYDDPYMPFQNYEWGHIRQLNTSDLIVLVTRTGQPQPPTEWNNGN